MGYRSILKEYSGAEPFFFIYCGEVFMNTPFDTRWAKGRQDWYAIYLLSGTLEVTINSETTQMSGGDMFVVSPHTPILYNNLKTTNEPVKYRLVHFLGADVEETLRECNITHNKVFNIGIHEELVVLWDELFKICIGDAEKLDYYFGITAKYLFLRISYYCENKNTKMKKLDKSIKYIHSHISEDIRVEELAKMEFLSPSRYRELFKIITGHSPSDYISALRIRLACKLFLDGNTSIEDVAKATGFDDRLYFQKFFKKHTGKTPGTYLKNINF
jgi:AraC-like DNA-binding protein